MQKIKERGSREGGCRREQKACKGLVDSRKHETRAFEIFGNDYGIVGD